MIDLERYYRTVVEKSLDEEYNKKFNDFLETYVEKYNIYFFVGHYPKNVTLFIQDITNYGCLMIGIFYLSDATPCTVVFVPSPEDRYIVSEIMSVTDMHVLNTNIINVNGYKNEKMKRRLLDRMFVEHKKMFEKFFTF